MTLHDYPVLPDIALSLGLERRIAEASQNGEVDTATIAACVLQLYPSARVKEGLVSLCDRFTQRVQMLAAKAAAADPPTDKRSLAPPPVPARGRGSAMKEWAEKLSATSLCLYLADGDVLRAHQLYWFTEAALVEEALEAKINLEHTRQEMQFESVLYAFGGKYAEGEAQDSAADGAVPIDSDEGKALLRSFGFTV